jgi:hypothetical protein
VRLVGQVPVEDRNSAPVRLSAHAAMEDEFCVEATAPTPPAITAPARNAATNFPDRFIFICLIPIIIVAMA